MQRPSRRRSSGRASAYALEPRVLLASAELLLDINLYTDDADPAHFAPGAGGVAYFSAHAPGTGRELYKTNGTAAGTVLVKDIIPGAGAGLAQPQTAPFFPAPQFTAVGSTTFFVADNGAHRAELWKTDGTAAGTVMVKDIYPFGTSSPRHLTAVGNVLYFTAQQNDGGGHQLWRSDGTAAGTRQVRVIEPPVSFEGADITGLTASGGKLYFAATHRLDGRGLWVSDGTAAGTIMLTDPFDGGPGDPANLFDAGGTLYFSGVDSDGVRKLYKTSGTAATTTRVGDVPVDPTVPLARLGTSVYFASGGIDKELYMTNGRPGGTVRVADVNPGPADAAPRELTVLGQHLYFSADGVHPFTGGPAGRQVFRTDGTESGTAMVTLLGFGAPGADPFGLAAANGRLFFGGLRSTLYVTDGLPFGSAGASTVALQEMRYDTRQHGNAWRGVLGTRLLYAGTDRPAGAEPWAADGAAAPVRLKDINTDNVGSDPSHPTPVVLNNKLYFTASNGTHGRELWVTDGTATNTRRITDLAPGEDDANPHHLTAFNGRVYFTAYGANARSIWSTDGTAAGTRSSIDLTALGVFEPHHMTAYNGALYFLALGQTPDAGYQFHLYKSDGTQAGTTLVKRVKTYRSQGTAGWQVIGGLLYFVVSGGGEQPAALWRSDGTPGGTYMLREWGYNDTGFQFAEADGLVYFIQGPSGFADLWATDGTVDGTYSVDAGMNLSIGHFADGLVPYRGRVYVRAYAGPAAGWALYRSDGTPSGTTRVDLPGWGIASGLRAYNDRLYYTVHDAQNRGSLYRSDGTAAGSAAVFSPGFFTGVSNAPMVEANDMLLFHVQNAEGTNNSLHWYATDGTAAGTSEVTGTYRAGYTAVQVGGRVLFTGEAPAKGVEWFRTTLPDTARPQATAARLATVGTGAHAVRVTFTENVAPSLTAADLVLTNLATGAAVPLAFSSVTFDGAADTAAFTVNPSRFAGGRLPPGRYRVSLAAGAVADASGNTSAAAAQFDLAVTPPATVAGRHVFYNGSRLDGGDAGADARDDSAIAAGKQALLPGGAATFANVTGYTKGINGIMIDVANLPPDTAPWARDFEFRVVGSGTDIVPSVPAPSAVAVRRGAGVNGSDRITIVWPGPAVKNGWLQVTMKATARTGLSAPGVFYFGNLVGDAGGPGPLKVDATDVVGTRLHLGRTDAAARDRYDFNRDGAINALDLATVRLAQRRAARLPTLVAAAAAAAASGEAIPPTPHRPAPRGELITAALLGS